MHAVRAVLIALALSATAGCNVTGPVDGDIVLDVPAGPVAPGSMLALSLINGSEQDVRTGPLPCTVAVEQRVSGKWQRISDGGPICIAIVISVAGGSSYPFSTQAPEALGTYRFVTRVSEGNASPVMIYSKPLNVVVFTY